MTRTDDVLTRLAAADPVTLPETPTAEEERQAAQLLERVLASAVHEPAPAAPAPRRRVVARRGVIGFAGAAALAVGLVLLVSPSQRSLADRAYAAVTAPQLFHVVTLTSYDNPGLEGAPGAPREAGATQTEAWYDTAAAPAFHTIHRVVRGDRDELLFDEAAGDQNRIAVRSRDEQPAFAGEIKRGRATEGVFPERFDPTAETKAALRNPDIREDGEVTVDGRRARRLVIDHPDPPAVASAPAVVDASETVLIDAETLYPIEFRYEAFFVRDGVRERAFASVRYTTFETLPRTRENLRLLKMGARP